MYLYPTIFLPKTQEKCSATTPVLNTEYKSRSRYHAVMRSIHVTTIALLRRVNKHITPGLVVSGFLFTEPLTALPIRIATASPLKYPTEMSMSAVGPSLVPTSLRIPRCGNWLPEDTWILRTWLSTLVEHVDVHPKALHPALREFQSMIEDDAALYMLFHQMFDQTPFQDAYSRDPFGGPQIRDFRHMLLLINEILTRAPSFNDNELIGLPLHAIIDWPMSTPAGRTAFLLPAVNAQFNKILTIWSAFLRSSASSNVLNESQTGWLGPPAQAAMRNSTCSRRTPRWTFESTFICKPSLPHFGYTSWDDFFTRRFRPGVRPVASPMDDTVIVNPCEAAPYRLARSLKRKDSFWLKAQPYSLMHMFDNDALSTQFVGGTLYQAFLDATNYHRWHSPVAGTITKAYVIPGTYFSQHLMFGIPQSEVGRVRGRGSKNASISSSVATWKGGAGDTNAQMASQSYAAAVATRAAVFIKADERTIGLIALLFVGLADVSTCEISIAEGQRLRKGDEIGSFHYGGSTVCLLLREGVDVIWDLHGQEAVVGLGSRNS
ncbi:Phophatidylserine decarboxylase-domain-containing protein [Bisporella sp. PMI_857]|nr:Phophatidylserine decarboxylase-domain-containing protein [Bisporella sp. PMI_857]